MGRYREYFSCNSCEGTGSAKPDCYLCNGAMYVSVRKAFRDGSDRSDLDDVERGLARCPACVDDGFCDICCGDGFVSRGVNEQQIARVLICALTGAIPPIQSRLPYGRMSQRDALLSFKAGRVAEDAGLIRWRRDMFGDDISLTDKGMPLAERAIVDWTIAGDAMLALVDDEGRWGTDGGACA